MSEDISEIAVFFSNCGIFYSLMLKVFIIADISDDMCKLDYLLKLRFLLLCVNISGNCGKFIYKNFRDLLNMIELDIFHS